MRNNIWLSDRLNYFLKNYFSDIKIKNQLVIFFGKRARTRLGSIQFDPKSKMTVIRITAFFKDEKIPQYIVDATIIHELVHYAHGFSSPLPQAFRFPHKGGVIKNEMAKRGLESFHLKSKIWLKKNWPNYIKLKAKSRKSKVRKIQHAGLIKFLFSDFFKL